MGAHLWVKGKPSNKFAYIAPTCQVDRFFCGALNTSDIFFSEPQQEKQWRLSQHDENQSIGQVGAASYNSCVFEGKREGKGSEKDQLVHLALVFQP